jgi:hypothetical protein
LVNVWLGEVYPPPVNVTVPVGVMLVPATVTTTLKLAPELTVADAGATVIVGVSSAKVVTVTFAVLLVAAYNESPA